MASGDGLRLSGVCGMLKPMSDFLSTQRSLAREAHDAALAALEALGPGETNSIGLKGPDDAQAIFEAVASFKARNPEAFPIKARRKGQAIVLRNPPPRRINLEAERKRREAHAQFRADVDRVVFKLRQGHDVEVERTSNVAAHNFRNAVMRKLRRDSHGGMASRIAKGRFVRFFQR